MSKTRLFSPARTALCLSSLSIAALFFVGAAGCDGSTEPSAVAPASAPGSSTTAPAEQPAAPQPAPQPASGSAPATGLAAADQAEATAMAAGTRIEDAGRREAASVPAPSTPRVAPVGPADEPSVNATDAPTRQQAAAPSVKGVGTSTPASPQTGSTGPDAGLGTGTGAQTASREARTGAADTTPVAIRMEPSILDFGDIATGDAGIGTVRLTNVSDEPRVMLDCRTSCGCTTTNCERNLVLEPGEYVEIEVKLDGGQRPQLLTKTVTFLFSEHAPLRLTVRGNAVSFVTVEPEVLDARRHPDGRVVLRSLDGEPFRIRSMFPPVLDDLPAEAKVEHELIFSYEQFREDGFRQRRILVRLDHPKCDRITISLAPNVLAPGVADGARPQPTTVTRSAALARLDTLLSAGQEEAALEMLESGDFGLEDTDNDQQTPLIKASRWGKARLIQSLLDEGADITAVDRLGRTPLVYAAQSKNLEAVQLLLDAGADYMRADDLGNTPIGWAAGFGTKDIVRALIDRGAAIDSSGGTLGFTPLIWASGFGEADVVELLLDNGADPSRADALEGNTALMHAARTNRHATARLLLERGASVADRNKEGSTALLVAARNAGADAAMIRLLVEAGADPTVKDERGRNAIDLAVARTDLRTEEVAQAVREAMRGAASR